MGSRLQFCSRLLAPRSRVRASVQRPPPGTGHQPDFSRKQWTGLLGCGGSHPPLLIGGSPGLWPVDGRRAHPGGLSLRDAAQTGLCDLKSAGCSRKASQRAVDLPLLLLGGLGIILGGFQPGIMPWIKPKPPCPPCRCRRGLSFRRPQSSLPRWLVLRYFSPPGSVFLAGCIFPLQETRL
jgi:hypothetical protein